MNQEDIPDEASEKIEGIGTVPNPFKTQTMTHGSDTSRGLLVSGRLLLGQLSLSPKQTRMDTAENADLLITRNNSNDKLIQIDRLPTAQSAFSPMRTIKETSNNTGFRKLKTEHTPIGFYEDKKVREEEIELANSLGGDETMHGALAKNIDKKIEQVVHTIPKNKYLSLAKKIGIIFATIIPFTLLWFQVQNSDSSSLVTENIEVISQIVLLLSKLIELNWSVRYIVMIDTRLMPFARYALVDPKIDIPSAIQAHSTTINQINKNIRNSLDLIDSELREKAYSYKVPVYEEDEKGVSHFIRDYNIPDFFVDIVSRGTKLAKTPAVKLNMTLPDISYILNNTLNDFLIAGEQLTPLLVEDTRRRLENQETLVISLWSVMSVIGIVILKIWYNAMRSFMKQRDQLINTLLMLDNKRITKHLQQVNKFAKVLEKGYFTPELSLKVQRGEFRKRTAKVQDSIFTKKSAKVEGINRTLIKLSGGVVLFILLILSVYIGLILFTTSRTALTMNKINLMVESNNYLYQFILTGTMFYDYIQSNGTTKVRNLPIKQELDLVLTNLTKAQDFFGSTLLKEDNGLTSNRTLYDVVQGDLCSIFPSSPRVKPQCYTTKGGILTKGIIGMNSFILSGLQTLLSSFDASPRAFSDMYAAINDPEIFMIESTNFYYLYPAYAAIATLIKNVISEELAGYKTKFGWITIVFGVLSFFMGIVGWSYLIRTFEKEVAQWMKMVRHIPWDIFVNNKLLKVYLIQNSQGILTATNL